MQTQKRSLTSMLEKLRYVYGEEKAERILAKVDHLIKQYGEGDQDKDTALSEKDMILITYGDSVWEEGRSPLSSLREFLQSNVGQAISGVHLLPFYPYSSDDGFSVIDYFQVNRDLGSWADIDRFSEDYELMFDAVINHISANSSWFRKYLNGDSDYQDYFIELDPSIDTSRVRRPRALPLLTGFDTNRGRKFLWTTFSEDQIDLNYKSEALFVQIVELLLFYVSQGARFLRLDAVGFLWKEAGTSCIHLEETHKLIQFFREVLDCAAPGTKLITETNVPHDENISYFGDGHNEAHLVYQFALPPLVLHAFQSGSAESLGNWADGLTFVSNEAVFFNFLASHDGIGVTPLKGILDNQEMDQMVKRVQDNGGKVSFKDNGDGTESPYELNINYFDALAAPDEQNQMKIDKFIAAHALLLSLRGVPGIYIHSLLGSRNDYDGLKKTGRYRSINREKLNREELEKELLDPVGRRRKILNRLLHLMRIRKAHIAFHPNADQQILFLNQHVFSLLRVPIDQSGSVIVLVNVSNEIQQVDVPVAGELRGIEQGYELITGGKFPIEKDLVAITLEPYQVKWIYVV